MRFLEHRDAAELREQRRREEASLSDLGFKTYRISCVWIFSGSTLWDGVVFGIECTWPLLGLF